MNDDAQGHEKRPKGDDGGIDDVERRLVELGRTAADPIDPRFADRLESSIRAMHAEPRPLYRRYLVRPAGLLVAAVLAIVAVVAVALDGPGPERGTDEIIVARPSPTAAPPTPSPEATPTAQPQRAATPEPTDPALDPTPAVAPPDVAEPTPDDVPPARPTSAPTEGTAPTAVPSDPPPTVRATPMPAASPSPAADPTPTAEPTPTSTPAATPQITLAITERRLRSVTLAWSIDDPDGISDLVVVAASPGGRRFAELSAAERSLVVPRPTDGPVVVVVSARDADGGELARSNRVAIAARR